MTSLYELSSEGRLAPAVPVAFDPAFAEGAPRWIRMVAAPQEDVDACLHALHIPETLFRRFRPVNCDRGLTRTTPRSS